VRDGLPGVDDLLLELVEEAVVLLRLLLVLRHALALLVFVLHLNELYCRQDFIRWGRDTWKIVAEWDGK
jgi:hypothetical protein